MLNICDIDILGSDLVQDDLHMHISKSCYGHRIVGLSDAKDLLEKSSIINMAGKNIVSLAIELGMGSEAGTRTILDVPFLIVFK